MLLTSLLLLVATQPGCRRGVEGDGGVAVLTMDLDGDSRPDELRVLNREVEIRYATTPPSTTQFWMGWEVFGGLQVGLEDLPRFPVRSRDVALRFIEDRVFDRICSAPDPSLLRLRQQRQPRTPLTWIKGPPQPPFAYLLREQRSWLLYRWFCPSQNAVGDAFGPAWLKEVAREGPYAVLKTCHGVMVNDVEKKQFAWLYLLDQPIDKLRHSSIGDVTIADGGVTIQLTLDSVDVSPQVRVRVDDGTITMVEGKR